MKTLKRVLCSMILMVLLLGVSTVSVSAEETGKGNKTKHTHTYETVLKKATLSKNGKKTNNCTECGYVSSKSSVIYSPKTMKLSTTKYTYNGKVKEPSVTVEDTKGKTLKKGTDYTVTYASGRKNVGKYAVTIKFKGNYSGEKKLYFYVLPSKTSKITVKSTTTTIKASWKEVAGATGYKVELLSSKDKVLKTTHTTKLNYTCKELTKATTYKVKVTAYKTISDKKYYSSTSKTLTTATTPAKPSLTIKAGTKSATFSWKKVAGTGYELQYATNSEFSNAKKVTVSDVSTLSKKVSSLKAGTKYYVRMRTFKTVGDEKYYSTWSDVKTVTPKAATSSQTETNNNSSQGEVWIPKTGQKYHTRSNCSNMKNPTKVTKQEAIDRGYEPCKRCH